MGSVLSVPFETRLLMEHALNYFVVKEAYFFAPPHALSEEERVIPSWLYISSLSDTFSPTLSQSSLLFNRGSSPSNPGTRGMCDLPLVLAATLKMSLSSLPTEESVE